MLVPDKRSLPEIRSCAHVASLREGCLPLVETARLAELRHASGFSIVAPDLSGKRLELLKEIVPEVSPVAVMLNTKNPQSQFELKEMQTAAQAMGGRRRLFYEVRRTAREQTRIYIGVLTHPEITPQRPTAWLRMQSAAN
jgi:hypothetical protein